MSHLSHREAGRSERAGVVVRGFPRVTHWGHSFFRSVLSSVFINFDLGTVYDITRSGMREQMGYGGTDFPTCAPPTRRSYRVLSATMAKD